MLRQTSRISLKSQIPLILAITMILSLLSLLILQPVQAETVRSAQIEKVIGIVHIKKAGSVKSFRAYEGMILYHGDHIRTEADSSVIFQVTDRGDDITVEEKSQLYISNLRNESGKMKTSFFIWSGSMWVQASTLTNSEDEFEIETPAAFMSVRGTTLLVGVDPETGESKFFIASGQGRVNKKGEEEQGGGTTLNPNERIVLDEDTDSDDYDNYKNIADLDDLIVNTGNAIIEAIIASKAAIDQENAEYITKLQEQQDGTGGTSQELIDRINQNLDNLVGNIVNNAINQNKVDEAAIKAFIEQINTQLDKKLDLDNVKTQELSAQEKAKQAQIKLLEEERKKKQEAMKLKQEELKKQNEQLQQKLKEQLEKQKEAKQQAAEAAKKRAAEEYGKKLTNNAAKLAFEAKQKTLAAEKAKQEAAVKAAADARESARQPSQPEFAPAPEPEPDPDPEPNPDPNPDPDPEPEPELEPDPADTTPPVLTIVSPTDAIFSNGFDQDIVVQTETGATLQLFNGETPVPFHTEISNDDVTIVTLTAYELAEGVYNFTVKATDAAGNETIQTVPAIHIDRTPPIIDDFDDQYMEALVDMTVEIGITGEKGALIQILHEGEPIASGTGDGDNPITITLPLLDEGEYWFKIKATDAAGNVTTLDVDYFLYVYSSEP